MDTMEALVLPDYWTLNSQIRERKYAKAGIRG
jgi:hypothetical protein